MDPDGQTTRRNGKWTKLTGQRGRWTVALGWRGQTAACRVQHWPTKDGATIAARHWLDDI